MVFVFAMDSDEAEAAVTHYRHHTQHAPQVSESLTLEVKRSSFWEILKGGQMDRDVDLFTSHNLSSLESSFVTASQPAN